MTLSLTEREIELVVSACNQYIELMEDGEDTHDYTLYELETGLGSALRKLYKGKNGEQVFGKYKTVTKYPTFEEWKVRKYGQKKMDQYNRS